MILNNNSNSNSNSNNDNLSVERIDRFDQEFLKFIDTLMASSQASIKVINLEQATKVSKYLAQLANHPATSAAMIEMAINELIINAIEHGLLKINYATKESLLKKNSWQEYIIKNLAGLSKDQFILVKCNLIKASSEIKVDIIDPGSGFNWVEYENQFKVLEKSLVPKHGRGTTLIKSVLGEYNLEYFTENKDLNEGSG